MSKRENIALRTWNNLPGYGQLAILGGSAFLLYRVVKKQIDKAEERRRLKIYQQSNTLVTYNSGGSSGSVVQALDLSTIAGEIYDAFYNNDPFGITEDETRAINVLRSVPVALAPKLSNTYRALYKKDLKADFLKALDSDEWEKVSQYFGG